MGDPALLNLLSVVISAVITAAGTVIAAYISRGKEKKAEPQKGKILLPPGYGSETKRFWNIRSIVIITFALIGIAIAARWLLGEIALKNTTSERLEFV